MTKDTIFDRSGVILDRSLVQVARDIPNPAYTSSFIPAPMLVNLHKKVSQIKAGTADGIIVFMGDSTTSGTSAQNQIMGMTFPTQLQKELQTTLGIPCTQDCFTGAHRTDAYGNSLYNSWQTTWDPRLTVGSTWITQFNGIGGPMWKFTGSSVSNISFTPTNAFDTIKITYITGATSGTLTIQVNGATVGAIDTSAATADRISTFTLSTPVSGTITLIPSSGSLIWVNGVYFFNSKIRSLLIVNGGNAGVAISSVCLAPAAYGPSYVLSNLLPDLTVVDGGINDLAASVTGATFQTNLTAFFNGLPSTSDKLLAVHNDAQGLTYPSSYSTNFSTIQSSLNIGLMKINELRWGPYVSAASMGFMEPDNIHPNAAGHIDKGNLWANYIISKI